MNRLLPLDIALRTALVINAIFVSVPMFFLVTSSFRESRDFYISPYGIPDTLKFDNFTAVWSGGDFATYLKNSIIVTGGSLVLVLALSATAGFVLGRYQFRWNAPIYIIFLTGMLVPAKLVIVPLFIQMKTMHLIDSHLGLILVYTAGALPAAVFIMTGFFRSLPPDLENAARIDQASEWMVFRKILLPLVRPGLAIVAIYSAIPIWNDFLLPLVLIQDPAKKTLMQGLTVFFGQYSSDWGALFAGLSLAALPLIVLYLVLSEQFIKGMTAGAVKG
jgi:raffinose/stachyose/melibiose transport system permease protein